MTIEQTLGQLPGVLVGGAVTGLVAWVTRRAQRGDTLAAESRAREHASTSRLAETAAKLRALNIPDDVIADTHDEYLKEMSDRWSQWQRTRSELVLFFQIAAMDVKDVELRADLQACAMLMEGSGPTSASWDDTPNAYKNEGSIRHTACRFAITAIGEYRRNESITPPTGWFGQQLDRVRDREMRRLLTEHAHGRTARVNTRDYQANPSAGGTGGNGSCCG